MVVKLRTRVFVDEQGFIPHEEFDAPDSEPTTWHILGKDSETNQFVGVARVQLDQEMKKAKISRVALLSECRGKKFGAALMSGLERLLPEWVKTCILAALIEKDGFYAKCGYARTNDEVFIDEGVPQCWMYKSMKQ